MARKFSLLIFILMLNYASVLPQNISLHISGKVINSISREPIRHASIQVLSVNSEPEQSKIGITTKKDGSFDLFFSFEIPFRIKVSHVSFFPKEFVVDNKQEGLALVIGLVPRVLEGEDVIVTAELASEEELKSPVTIDKMSTIDVQQLASFDVFDLVSTLREVDVATQSMTMQSVNTRGFNSSANKRFLQLTDGIDNRAPGLNFPIGNLMGLVDLDIASVEILPGPSSSQYGSSAMNGVLVMKSKDPFINQGISFQSKGGFNDFNLGGDTFLSASGNGMMDLQGRYAKALSDKLAFKITGSHVRGTDWRATNYDNVGLKSNILPENPEKHPKNPGYNGVNIYGDENFVYLPVYAKEELSSNIQTVFAPGEFGPVTRTGYRETDLVDYKITTTRAAVSIHYKFSRDYKLMLDGRYGITNSLYTGDSRIRLQDFSMYQGSLGLELKNLSILGYSTWQYSGNSYDVTKLSRRLLESAKKDSDWYRDFSFAYKTGISILGIPKGDLEEARNFADSGVTLLRGKDAHERYEPGSEEFLRELQAIKYNTDPGEGAAIRDDSRLYHVEGSYSFQNVFKNTQLEVGGNYRYYDLISNGTIFPDTASNDITNYELGGYITINDSYLDEKLNLNAALRVDKNENFAPRISPRVSVSYSPDKKNHFRFSFQNGFRYPSVREQFINNNLGKARLVGGLAENVGQYNLQRNSITEQAIDRFNQAVIKDINSSPDNPVNFNRSQAELNNLDILENGIIREDQLLNIVPEKVNAFELGYRRLFTRNLYLDLNYYISLFNDFLGITRVVKPRSSPSKDLFTAASQVNNSLESDRFFVYSNARDRLIIQGLSFDLEYLSGGFMSSLNGSWANLILSSDDPIIPGFNTPLFKMNFEWGHRAIAPNVGFKMIYRFRTKYFWQSSFVDGPIATHGHFDFQINTRIPSARSTLKFGVTNLGINEYYNMYGGPSIGSILFATFTFNPKSFQ